MKDEEVKQKIMVLAKFKPNPHHYIIIDKWNKREYNKIKFKIFDILEKEIDKRISQQNWVKNFSTIETPIDFWELYKNKLPLWSNINNNCYIKIKEN